MATTSGDGERWWNEVNSPDLKYIAPPAFALASLYFRRDEVNCMILALRHYNTCLKQSNQLIPSLLVFSCTSSL